MGLFEDIFDLATDVVQAPFRVLDDVGNTLEGDSSLPSIREGISNTADHLGKTIVDTVNLNIIDED